MVRSKLILRIVLIELAIGAVSAVVLFILPRSKPLQSPPTTSPVSPQATLSSSPSPKPSLVNNLSGHSLPIHSLAISPDSQILVSGSQDKAIKLWNLKTGKLIATLNEHLASVTSFAISLMVASRLLLASI